MPGVPSGRGCNACRKVKKKCEGGDDDVQCARCKRLRIPCVGLGQKRYKFQDEGQKFEAIGKKTTAIVVPLPHQATTTPQFLTRNPSNSMTRLVSAMVDKIDPATDIRYQLIWNFGGYLAEIPRRLGANAALDAASDVLVAAHTNYCVLGRPRSDNRLLVKYSHALTALRDALDNPVQAHSSETLCAIMVLMIVQALTTRSKGFTASHPEGATQVLKSRGLTGPCNDFERTLLRTLRGPVVFEALVNDKIHFTQQEWRMLVESGPDANIVDVVWFAALSRLPELMQRCRRALHDFPATKELPDLMTETHDLLESIRGNIVALRERLRDFEKNPRPAGMIELIHSHRVRMLGMGLSTGILYSCVLSALSGMPLHSETNEWSMEILCLSEVAVRWRPLGAMAMIFCLYTAWIAASSIVLRDEVRALLEEYEITCLGSLSVSDMGGYLNWMEQRFFLREIELHKVVPSIF
ncbi:MAG: hypothetical protein M1825_000688 [Sarcosagium campestre]|nr:MAG: hypothetical protein M1825_000688 [Sarcosagium campestre]